MAEPAGGAGERSAKPGETPPWRAGIDAERRKRPRRITDQRAALRRLTVTAAVVAATLNAALFVQTATTQMSVDDVDNAILTVISDLFPESVRPPSQSPVASPTPPLTVTGGS